MAVDLTWSVAPNTDITSGLTNPLSNTFANSATFPFDPSTSQARTLSGGSQEGEHMWGFPDMSTAPGPHSKGWRLVVMWNASGGTGTNGVFTLRDGITDIWNSGTHFNVLTGSTSSRPIFVYPIPDGTLDEVDLDDLRVHFSYARAGGNNQVITVAGVRLEKSPIAEVDEYEGPGPFAGHEHAAYRASDLVDLGGVDEEDVLIWPDATGRGQHLWRARSSAINPYLDVTSEAFPFVEFEDGQVAGKFHDHWMGGVRFAKFVSRIDTFPGGSGALASLPMQGWEQKLEGSPLVPNNDEWDKILAGFRGGPFADVLMVSSEGSGASHSDGTLTLSTNTWYYHTTWVPNSDSDNGAGPGARSWIDTDGSPSASPQNSGTIPSADTINRFERIGVGNRESNDRPWVGGAAELAYFDFAGLTFTPDSDWGDIDAGREAWVEGEAEVTTAALDVEFALIATGRESVSSDATLGAEFGMSAAGHAEWHADASLGVSFGLVASGSIPEENLADLSMQFGLVAEGRTASEASATLGAEFGFEASGTFLAANASDATLGMEFGLVAAGHETHYASATLGMDFGLDAEVQSLERWLSPVLTKPRPSRSHTGASS